MRCEETQELITALVDDEVSDTERPQVESHLLGCPRCRLTYEQEKALKSEMRAAGIQLSAPRKLRQRILSDLGLFPEAMEETKWWREILWSLRQPALVMALLVLLILPALYVMQPATPSVALTALETYQEIGLGRVSFVKASSPAEVKERLSHAAQGRFDPMGYDLSMANLKPAGWMVQEVHGRKILVAVYQGRGSMLTCYTFLGTERDAPGDASVTFDPEKGIRFYSFSRGEVNAVLHREGELICILVSKMPMADLLALARAKAQPS